MNTPVPATEVRDSFTFEVDVEREDGSTYTRTFVPSVLHINELGLQSVASRTESRPLTDENNWFLAFERRPNEQLSLVNIPIHDLTVDEIEKRVKHSKYAARFHDEEKVTFLFIYRKTKDGWVFRRATERIFLTDEGNGAKRAKMMAHRSLAGGVFDADKINIKIDHSMHTEGERCKRDGTFVASFDVAMKLGGLILHEEPRTNIRLAGNDGEPWHLKGDVIWTDKVRGGYDILTCPCNLKRDGGLMTPKKVVIGTTGPQRQGESVQSNPQINAFGGHVYLDRDMYVNGSLSVWEHQSRAKMGKTLSRVLLGKNPHFSGLDPAEQKLNQRAHVAGYVERELGDSFISPAVTMSNIKAAEHMYGADSKHRVPLPGAFSYSLTAPEILDDMCFEGPRPEPGEIAVYSFGFVPHEDIFFDIADTGGGADGDDHFAIIAGFVSEGFDSFAKNEFIADLVRFPQGASIHEGKVGVEHSLVRISQSTQEFKEIFRRAHAFPVLDFHKLPASTADLPVPEINEAPKPEGESLTFMEEVRQLAALRGAYGRFSLRVTSLVYLATTFFDGELPEVNGEKYTLPLSMEAAIDTTAKHASSKGAELVDGAAIKMTSVIEGIIKEHLDSKVDLLFAARAGLLDSDGNLPDEFEETTWSMSVREEVWMQSYNRLCNFTTFLSDQYGSAFQRAVTALGGYEKNSTTERFWDGVKQRHHENKHESQIVMEIASSMAEAGLSVDELQNLQRMQTMDIMRQGDSYMVSEALFDLEMVEQSVAAVDTDLHQNILAGVMDQVWTPLIKKIATSYDGDYRTDPFIGQVVDGFDRYFGGGFSNMGEMITRAEEDTDFLVSCMERAVNEAAELEDEYNDDSNIVLCGADTTRGHPCKLKAVSCPHH